MNYFLGMKITIKMMFNLSDFFVIQSERDPKKYKWKFPFVYLTVKVGTLNMDIYNKILHTWESGK